MIKDINDSEKEIHCPECDGELVHLAEWPSGLKTTEIRCKACDKEFHAGRDLNIIPNGARIFPGTDVEES